jgi:nitrite reductase/ring-hydroxylating ferredoxin subunit
MKKIRICELNQLTDPGSRGFVLPQGDAEVEGFVVHKDGDLAAYVNSCPHTGAALNWIPHQFLDLEEEFIQCSLHGAIFRAEDGFCVHGPCVGESLKSIPLVLEEGVIWVSID